MMSDKKQGHDFSVGQKVRCIDAANAPIKWGEIYEITRIKEAHTDVFVYLAGHNDNGQGWYASRFESVEEEPDENAKKIKNTLDDLKAVLAEHLPELQAYLSETEKELILREERDHWKKQADKKDETITRLEDSRDIQAKTFNVIREHLSDAGARANGNVADRVKDALDTLVEQRDHWKEQAKIARTRGEHKSDRISDLLRERGEIAELESIILNQGLNKKADLLRERNSLRDKVETKDAIIAKQAESIRCLKASRFDALDEARRLREERDSLKASTVDTKSAQALVDTQKDRADKAEAELAELKKRIDGQTTTIKILREQRDQVVEFLNAF